METRRTVRLGVMSNSANRFNFFTILQQAVGGGAEHRRDPTRADGFTLVELLVSLCVSLLLLGGVVSLFGFLGDSVNASRSDAEMLQNLRHASYQLHDDLANLTVRPDPENATATEPGFFEYVEGPHRDADYYNRPEDATYTRDTGLGGDDDDVLHFTTMSADGASEVVWFLTPDPNFSVKNENEDGWTWTWNRETEDSAGKPRHEKRYRLHRYVRRIDPDAQGLQQEGVSMGGKEKNREDPFGDDKSYPNTLETLALRKNRFAHRYGEDTQFDPMTRYLYEKSLNSSEEVEGGTEVKEIGQRINETILLENVLGFDVKVWDPRAKIYQTAVKQGEAAAGGGGGGGGGNGGGGNAGDGSEVHLIDDSEGAPGFVPSAASGWITQSPKPLAYLENTHKLKIINQVSGTQAEWSFPDLPNGQYTVHTTWWYTPSRCTASYTIGWGDFGNSGGGVLATKELDQIQAPAGFTDDDGWTWEELGTVEVEHGELKVRLEDGIGHESKNLMADAMRIECLNCSEAEDPTAPPTYTQDPGAPEETVPLVPGDPGYPDPGYPGTTQVGQGGFADLNYLSEGPINNPTSDYSGSGTLEAMGTDTESLVTNTSGVATYDSWSGLNSNAGIVGFDNPDENGETDGIIDTAGDLRLHPPYAVPLQGIQIEIRIYEPTSKSVRTVKIQQGLSGD